MAVEGNKRFSNQARQMQASGVIRFWRSLRARLILLVLLASVPLLAITLYTVAEIRNGEVENTRLELQGLSRLAEGRLHQAAQASQHLLYALSQLPAIALCDGVNPGSRLSLSGRNHFRPARATKRFVAGDPALVFRAEGRRWLWRSHCSMRARTDFAPELPNIMGVESEIREALTNLVFNADGGKEGIAVFRASLDRVISKPPKLRELREVPVDLCRPGDT